MGEEMTRGFEAITRGATSDERCFHAERYGNTDQDLLRCKVQFSLASVQSMSDPLSEVIALLRPRTVFSKRISGAGRWGVRYSEFGQPSFGAVLDGRCLLAVDGHPVLTLETGDFVLLPATPGFTMSGFEPVTPERIDPKLMSAPSGEVRHGTRGGRPDLRLLGGYFALESPDAS
ncbi:MAG TPA: cupin domain-containing protein, partial [Polyangiaceae bacterium]|nr:cupin domain-containing protein [Polyangiaceae bacterium]